MKKCVLCGGKEFVPVYTVTRHGSTFPICQCADCSLVFQHPFPKDIAGLYKEDYFSGEGFDPTVDYAAEMDDPGWRHSFTHERLKYLEGQTSGRRIMDVGCAMGFFLSVAKERGWECYGVELSSFAAKNAKKLLGAKRVHNGTLSSVPFKKNFFDCITMFDVIEHLEDPIAAIRKCYSLLRPGGILVVETADVTSLTALLRREKWGYFLLGHLVYFSRKTLRRSFLDSGFSSVHILRGDEVSAFRKASWVSGVKRKLRSFAIATVRKIGIGDFSVGGMVGIGRK